MSMRTEPHATPRLAVDIGGTFTDAALERGERLWTSKVLTDPEHPARGFMQAATSVLELAGIDAAGVGLPALRVEAT